MFISGEQRRRSFPGVDVHKVDSKMLAISPPATSLRAMPAARWVGQGVFRKVRKRRWLGYASRDGSGGFCALDEEGFLLKFLVLARGVDLLAGSSCVSARLSSDCLDQAQSARFLPVYRRRAARGYVPGGGAVGGQQ